MGQYRETSKVGERALHIGIDGSIFSPYPRGHTLYAMSLCREIARAHGGNLHISTDKNKLVRPFIVYADTEMMIIKLKNILLIVVVFILLVLLIIKEINYIHLLVKIV